MPAAMKRDVLKWLQSLDLSHRVSNVKRDLQNGFLVAEICSRYYGSAVQMHAFDNGVGSAAKADNWGQLVKFCKPRGVPIDAASAAAASDGVPDAAISLLERLYEFFTNRKLQELPQEVIEAQEAQLAEAARAQAADAKARTRNGVKGLQTATEALPTPAAPTATQAEVASAAPAGGLPASGGAPVVVPPGVDPPLFTSRPLAAGVAGPPSVHFGAVRVTQLESATEARRRLA